MAAGVCSELLTTSQEGPAEVPALASAGLRCAGLYATGPVVLLTPKGATLSNES